MLRTWRCVAKAFPATLQRIRAGRLIAARVAWAWWDPRTEICRRRLRREFDELLLQ
jgi:hypothetical protein